MNEQDANELMDQVANLEFLLEGARKEIAELKQEVEDLREGKYRLLQPLEMEME